MILALAVVTSLWLWADGTLGRYVVSELAAVVATGNNNIVSMRSSFTFFAIKYYTSNEKARHTMPCILLA